MYKFHGRQNNLKSECFRKCKDELGNASFHLRVDKIFDHLYLELFKMKINLPKTRAKPVSTQSSHIPESPKKKRKINIINSRFIIDTDN